MIQESAEVDDDKSLSFVLAWPDQEQDPFVLIKSMYLGSLV